MTMIRLHCYSCEQTSTIPLHHWSFEADTVICPFCEQVMDGSHKSAMDGAIQYLRVANEQMKEPFREGTTRFAFEVDGFVKKE
ncbi:hypothetical protein [Brevibacillus dissolubilis]|uniref:hypothetical protein n=1 Tax=Brevibacillus dissolubilis TaxID=1844116 RepID=UPI001117865A|nr:hypothetical protein [Brevibacillus dissolubilis]